ncbi:hypothetical protein A4D02_35650 [Niastella koreensis]|uniref:Surface antigen (D15) n=2 Tax=Niastella koreensis TaxID=354356 RepID=G8TKF7_NIAKG|nr:hypothetical protein [Niastella koreensis]AEV97613.1 hypothetical protein Niako_1239 [Niastella koreensis GR20-10]OQP44214.1 hypothetical protein A4D02_35650 [Niastella koreensis]
MQPGVLISKNELPFLPHQGKGIRHILIKEFGFDKTLTDTAKEISYFGKDFVKHLHRITKEKIIRNNLFIKERTALNANVVADNERYLRSLDYIHDARIFVDTIANEPDSIDLIVVTKDFLSIAFQLNQVTKDRFKAIIGDVNIMGTAQRVQFTTVLEKNRDPDFGYEILYIKNSIANTFINATIGYSTINSDLYNGTTDEHTWHVAIERPLVSQYLHVAGAVKFAHSQTYNNYVKPDSLFYYYHFDKYDAWIGYNLGIRKFLFLKSMLNRQFISIRYFRNRFNPGPYQVNNEFNFRFNDQEAVLAQFTFFRQNFYKTNYVFGFGITEDVPYGYNIALTTGWYKQLHMERLYYGIDANRYVVTDRGYVRQYFLRAGSFLNGGKIQDATILTGASIFSRVFSFRNLKMRQYLRFSYTKQFNRIGLDPLGINNVFGLQYISSDSASGHQRSNVHTETIFFLKYKALGFKFAPFASADIAFFTPENKNYSNSGFYFGLGGGMRIRNENILFGTIELRFMYFPRKSSQHNAFKLTLDTNLHFRYNNSYVKEPDIIQVNSDPNNNIY